MEKLFTALYNYFQKEKGRLYLIIAILVFCIGFSVYNLKIEEDIFKIFPDKNEIEEIEEVLNRSGLKDKVFVSISSEKYSQEELAASIDSFVSITHTTLDSTLLHNVVYEFDDQISTGVSELVYENLPVYYTEKDYARIDSLLQDSSLFRTQLLANKTTLTSPAGFIMKSMVLKDPFGTGFNVLKRLNELNIEKEFELKDGKLYHPEKNLFLLYLTPTQIAKKGKENILFAEKVNEIVSKTSELYKGDVEIYAYGGALVAAENATQIRKDIFLTVSITIALIFVLLIYYFKDFFIVIKLFIPVLLAAGTTLLVFSLLGKTVSIISIGIGSIILGITIDFSLHIAGHWREGKSPEDIFRDILSPLFMSSITTSLAFFALVFVGSPALTDLGLFTGISVFVASIYSLFFLPHFLKKLPENSTSETFHINKKIKYVLFALLLGAGASVFVINKVSFDDNLMNINFLSDEMKIREEKIQTISKASLRSSYLFSKGNSLDESLVALEQDIPVLDSLLKNHKIDYYTKVTLLLKSKDSFKNQEVKWNTFWNTERIEKFNTLVSTVGQDLKFNEKAFKPFRENTNFKKDYFDESEINFLLSSVFAENIQKDNNGYYIMSIIKNKNPKELHANVDKFKNTLFDKQLFASQLINSVSIDFDRIVNYSLIAVFLVLLIAYGRIELAILTFSPILISWLITMGCMHIFEIKFNLINIIISSFIFGLGIDYSIFYMNGHLNWYKYGKNEIGQYRESILLSSLTTIIGIGVLILAQHPALRSIGVLSLIGILSVTLVSLTFIPLVFQVLIGARALKKHLPHTALTIVLSLFALVFLALNIVLLHILALPLSIKKVKNTVYDDFFHYTISWVYKTVLSMGIHFKKEFVGFEKGFHLKPQLYIANHQSSFDIPFLLMKHPKLIFAVNDSFSNNPFFGFIVRQADFFNTSHPYESYAEKVKAKIARGYSILIFPEGTRNETPLKLKRFHKGGFFIAEELKLDVRPILLNGISDILPKGTLVAQPGIATLKLLPKIKHDDLYFGENYVERTKKISSYVKEEYKIFLETYRNEIYLRKIIDQNYIFKGPIVEWYEKVKVSLENNYKLINRLLPKEGKIVDIGCGYGFSTLLLGMSHPDRKVVGIDYDKDKIEVAANTISKSDNIQFVHADATKIELETANGFILSDILHYLPRKEQEILVNKCVSNLTPNGVLLIRDANAELETQQKGTWLTEFFSTKFGFNKTQNQLEFITKQDLIGMLKNHSILIKTIKSSKITSNIVYLITLKH